MIIHHKKTWNSQKSSRLNIADIYSPFRCFFLKGTSTQTYDFVPGNHADFHQNVTGEFDHMFTNLKYTPKLMKLMILWVFTSYVWPASQNIHQRLFCVSSLKPIAFLPNIGPKCPFRPFSQKDPPVFKVWLLVSGYLGSWFSCSRTPSAAPWARSHPLLWM